MDILKSHWETKIQANHNGGQTEVSAQELPLVESFRGLKGE